MVISNQKFELILFVQAHWKNYFLINLIQQVNKKRKLIKKRVNIRIFKISVHNNCCKLIYKINSER